MRPVLIVIGIGRSLGFDDRGQIRRAGKLSAEAHPIGDRGQRLSPFVLIELVNAVRLPRNSLRPALELGWFELFPVGQKDHLTASSLTNLAARLATPRYTHP